MVYLAPPYCERGAGAGEGRGQCPRADGQAAEGIGRELLERALLCARQIWKLKPGTRDRWIVLATSSSTLSLNSQNEGSR